MGGGVIFFNLQGRRSGEEVVLKRRLAVHLNGFDRVMDKSERKRNRMIFLYPSRDKFFSNSSDMAASSASGPL
jgi:hypothetical protein